ncbi:proteasome subunit beta type-6-like protein [Dinothrombium tinctorium]|uniref:Proteasome subunit beta n=1 Tax=Dinothrombium tinctorium TaxID=1965070 RepID=A0A443QVC6_9ACAR|nr:proteasome subunit beta type-6-like protein [Dinothrombium tinctorium]RWS06967.1 proteasome subunit beta type-6-like protein [Dinothrombium tinctorium]
MDVSFDRNQSSFDFNTVEACDNVTPEWLEPDSTGTTIMAVEFADGVVIGADSRATRGFYVSNRVSDKVNHVSDHIYCCRSGSAADTQAILDTIRYHLSFYEMELGEPALVKVAANLFKEMCYTYRDQLTAGIIVAGWDKRYGGQVYSIPLGGMMVRQSAIAGGSGGTYIYGYIDKFYKPRMTREECIKFVIEGISLAMERDASSGGVIRVAIIDKEGVEKKIIAGGDLPKFHEK